MGFSYERGVGEMLENMGHRAESIMEKTFDGLTGEDNLWEALHSVRPDLPWESRVRQRPLRAEQRTRLRLEQSIGGPERM
jgi:hypothetical protein